MSGASGTTISAQSSFPTEFSILNTDHLNVLLEGPAIFTEAALRQLQPLVRKPVVWHHTPTPFELPDGQIGTLILKEVGALTADDQKRLLGWIVDTRSSTQ